MTEFQTRTAVQRRVLSVVNAHPWQEELMGLSRKAIDRWLVQNGLTHEGAYATVLKSISGKLRFLANKSQQQITEEYRSTSMDVADLVTELEVQLSRTDRVS